jgi:hypothetical protein
MRARVLFAVLVAMSTVVIAGPASAKVDIAKANISGPGLGGGIRIEPPDTDGLWDSGLDLAGGLDDTRADSVEELGLTPADLGPGYLVAYRFFRDDLVRQDLYPYAKGGPVTYTPPGQRVAEGQPWGGTITAGWYRSSRGFFDYLVDHGLPEQNPVAPAATGEVPSGAGGVPAAPWTGIVMVLVGFAALSVAVVAVRRRVLAVDPLSNR